MRRRRCPACQDGEGCEGEGGEKTVCMKEKGGGGDGGGLYIARRRGRVEGRLEGNVIYRIPTIFRRV